MHSEYTQIIKYLHGVNRVMFSFRLLSSELCSHIQEWHMNCISWWGDACVFILLSLPKTCGRFLRAFPTLKGLRKPALYFTFKILTILFLIYGKKNVKMCSLFLNNSSDPYEVHLHIVRMSHLVTVLCIINNTHGLVNECLNFPYVVPGHARN